MDLLRFRLLAQVGAGRDGISYRAWDIAGDRPVELRLLSGAADDPERCARMVKRLRSLAMLEHPSLTRVLDLDLANAVPQVVLEWLDGKTLAGEVSKSRPLPAGEALELVGKLAAALAAAHRFGLAHGSLRPAGIRLMDGRTPKIDVAGTDTFTPPAPDPFLELDTSCRAPEVRAGSPADSAADVFSLGIILLWLLTGEHNRASMDKVPRSIVGLVQEMLAAAPADRPLVMEVERRATMIRAVMNASNPAVTTELNSTPDVDVSPTLVNDLAPLDTGKPPVERLGRFRLLTKLGEGGMGAVYRGEDITDGSQVAVKILRPDRASRPESLRRFQKEARLLAEVNNPYVTNLLEVNEDQGTFYLVMEFVAGKPLNQVLAERGQMDETTALTVIADVARGLVEAHERGIVHRDIKPDNILIMDAEPGQGVPEPQPARHLRVKLSDFGLARHVVESESLDVTSVGAVVGTPLYMSPEQCTGKGKIDPRSDVYSMGITLFQLLAGRQPFIADTPLAVLSMQVNTPPPPLRQFNPNVSDAICRVVEKCLAKAPEARFGSAGDLLRELERLLRGEPTSIAIHPRLPACDPRDVLQYDWAWELDATPAQLWPHVSNTDRLNRAAGLPAVEFSTRLVEEKGGPGSDLAASGPGPRVERVARTRKAGMVLAWEEHPFEWIEGRRMGVLREFSKGPFKWLVSVVEMEPRADSGTRLTHKFRVAPSGILGRTVAAVEIGIRARRALDRVYRRIDAALTGKLGAGPAIDPFEETTSLSRTRRGRLDGLLDRLSERGIDPTVTERLGDFLAHAPGQEVARIRPLVLARRLALDPDQVVAACLHGAREGLLVLLWDILCPVCRIPSEVKETLRVLRDHGRCEACNLDFELDFANSVEMIFRAHPEIRTTELATYCIGGPAQSPHVAAQARVGPGERIELELALAEGSYRLRGPQLPFSADFRVQPGTSAGRWDLNLLRGPSPELPRTLKAGGQVLVLTNPHDQELVVRVERTAPRADALTAARASALALFRQLFPGEILSPGQLVSVATITLLVSELDNADGLYEQMGDAQAFSLIHEHFRLLEECIRREGGALVKTVREGVLASFSESTSAVRVGLDSQGILARNNSTRDLRLRIGVHRGPAMVATLNEHLDYFGTTVHAAAELPALAQGGELLLTQAVASDPQVAALLRTRHQEGEISHVDLPGLPGGLVHRLKLLQ